MINKNIIIVILLIVLVFLVNYNVLEPFQQFGDIDDLAIKGPPGSQGPQGPQGNQGGIGDTGTPGNIGPKGEPGIQGPQGVAGSPGSPGSPGTTGPKGDPGVIRREDTAVDVPGPTGPQGPKGDVGPPGDDGIQGAPGTNGNPGPKGDKGDKGDPGNDASSPRGVVSMWSGSETNVPDGWQLCDGKPFLKMDGNAEIKNGNFVLTPDLRGRFVLGKKDSADIGETGGFEKVALTTEQMPKHTHKVARTTTENEAKTPTHFYNNSKKDLYKSIKAYRNEGGHKYAFFGSNEQANIGDSSLTGGQTDGTTKPHNNMPPYYVLAFIIKK